MRAMKLAACARHAAGGTRSGSLSRHCCRVVKRHDTETVIRIADETGCRPSQRRVRHPPRCVVFFLLACANYLAEGCVSNFFNDRIKKLARRHAFWRQAAQDASSLVGGQAAAVEAPVAIARLVSQLPGPSRFHGNRLAGLRGTWPLRARSNVRRSARRGEASIEPVLVSGITTSARHAVAGIGRHDALTGDACRGGTAAYSME